MQGTQLVMSNPPLHFPPPLCSQTSKFMQNEARKNEAWLQTCSALARDSGQLDMRCDDDFRRFITCIYTCIIGA